MEREKEVMFQIKDPSSKHYQIVSLHVKARIHIRCFSAIGAYCLLLWMQHCTNDIGAEKVANIQNRIKKFCYES